MPLLPNNSFVGPALGFGWLAFWIIASIIYRRSKGKPLLRPRFDHPLFLETWRSGHCLRNVITRFGGARNCLWIAVNENSLLVGPHFPFNLMFLPEIYHLEYDGPGHSIRAVERADGLLTRNRVRVTIERLRGGEEIFDVYLRDPDGFIRAVEIIRKVK